MRQLLNGVQPVVASPAVAAGTTVITGATIDTMGFQDVTVLASLGAITATGTATLKVAQGDAADGSDKQDVAGTAVSANDTQGNKILATQIYRPTQRYITPILTRATANVAVNEIIVLKGEPAHVPCDQPNVITGAALNSPALGTA